MSDQRKERCDGCRWWEQSDDGVGFCRRYPPRPMASKPHVADLVMVWSETRADDWCGEFQPKDRFAPATEPPATCQLHEREIHRLWREKMKVCGLNGDYTDMFQINKFLKMLRGGMTDEEIKVACRIRPGFAKKVARFELAKKIHAEGGEGPPAR